MLRNPFRGAGWMLGLVTARPEAPEEGRKRAAAGGAGQAGGALLPGGFAVDMSRIAMAAPLEE
jgi:hypothetical protein